MRLISPKLAQFEFSVDRKVMKLLLFSKYGTVAPRSSIRNFFRPGARDQQLNGKHVNVHCHCIIS